MAKKYSGVDASPWKVCDHAGKTLRGGDGKPLTGFDGYRTAAAVAREHGGVAIRA